MEPQTRILNALVDLVATRGIAAVSVRAVAAAAGVSPALVQYHFGTRDRLMATAFGHVHERLAVRLDDVEPADTTRELLRRYLLAWFPLDRERRADATVWLAFAAYAATDARLAAEATDTDTGLVAALAGVVARGVADGSVRPDLDPRVTAALLLAALDGLIVRALTHPDPAELLPLLDALVDRLLAPQGTAA